MSETNLSLDGSGFPASTSNLLPEIRKPSSVRAVLVAIIILFLVLSVVFIALYAHATNDDNSHGALSTDKPSTTASPKCSSQACVLSSSDIIRKLDTSVKPCDDFYRYSCGGFVESSHIRDDQSMVNSFSFVLDFVDYALMDLLQDEELMSNYSKEPNSSVYKALSYYQSCMNESEIEAAGTKPILKLIEDYGSWTITNKNWTSSSWTLEKVLARIAADLGAGALVSVGITPSLFNTSDVVVGIKAGSSGIEGSKLKDQLIRSLTQEEKFLEAYKKLMKTAFKLLGAGSSVALDLNVAQILLFESKFIQLKGSLQEQAAKQGYKNVVKTMLLSELNNLTSKFNWTMYLEEFFRGTGKSIQPDQELLIVLPNDLKKVIDHVTSKSPSLLANEIMWTVVRKLMPSLPKAFRMAESDVKKVFSGVKTPPSRWKTCSGLTNKIFPYPTALLFDNAHVSEEARKRAADLFIEIKGQFIDGLEEQTWMDNKTRDQARIKLNAMGESIGYPAFIKDSVKLNKMYERIPVSSRGFFQNHLNVLKGTVLNSINELGKLPDKSRFPKPPVGVNAFYDPSTNRMAILIGMLVEPLYQSERLKALNYGAIGMVVGHEITHGFDVSGSQFDEKGNLRSWWTTTSHRNFEQRSHCLAEQYNNTFVYGRKVDGVKTLSENIADNGGLKYAYRAYQKWRDTNGVEDELPALNFNNDQLFFIGFAQTWCAKYREEAIETRLKSDTHSLNPVRVRVPVSNFPEFSKAFGCTPPSKTCSVW